jgi:formyl-CoA transferase
MLGIVPKFSDTPGAVGHAGLRLGEHNAEVYGEWLGYSEARMDDLHRRGIV